MPHSSVRHPLARAFIWAFVGAIFALLYVPIFELLHGHLPHLITYLFAAVGAGSCAALVYSSMRLAVIVAGTANVAVLIYLVMVGAEATPHMTMLVGGVLGLLIGALFGAQVCDSRVCQGDAKIIAGALAGLSAGVVTLPLLLVSHQPPLWLMVALQGAVCGVIYIRIASGIIRRYSDLLPPVGDGAVVGLGIGAISALGYWSIATTLLPGVAQETLDLVAHITAEWPRAVLACAGSAALAGGITATLGSEWVKFDIDL